MSWIAKGLHTADSSLTELLSGHHAKAYRNRATVESRFLPRVGLNFP